MRVVISRFATQWVWNVPAVALRTHKCRETDGLEVKSIEEFSGKNEVLNVTAEQADWKKPIQIVRAGVDRFGRLPPNKRLGRGIRA